MPRKEQVAAALRYLSDKADLKRRYERLTSLDQPQDADALDMALEMGGSMVPGVGQALAARDFERARRADDEAGMAMAAASAVPVGKLVGALKQYDPTMQKIFIGKSAKTWDAAAATRAEEMEVAGADPETIWRETGTFRSPDGQLRQEISDKEMRLKNESKFFALKEGKERKLPFVISHEKLTESYPEAKRTIVFRGQDYEGGSASPGPFPEYITFGKGMGKSETKDTVVHELQHLVQNTEKFAPGSHRLPDLPVPENIQKQYDRLEQQWEKLPPGEKRSALVEEAFALVRPFSGYERYARAMGEAEARAAAARRTLSEKQRRQKFPLESYDVPIHELWDQRK
jgi:hypothetical protein